jgi:hypothetical protein
MNKINTKMPNGFNTAVDSIINNNISLFQSIIHAKSPFHKHILKLFQIACEYNRMDIVQYLLTINPKIHIREGDDRAFRLACSNGNLQIANFLLEKNNNVNIQRAFIETVCSSNTYIVDWLYKLISNKSEGQLSNVLNEACIKMVKNQIRPIFRNIVNDYMHLLDFEKLLTLAFINYNLDCMYYIAHLVDNDQLIEVISLALDRGTAQSYEIIKYLMIYVDNPTALFDPFIKACRNGDEQFLDIMLTRFRNKKIKWMFPTVCREAFNKNHTRIVHIILSRCKELPLDILSIYQEYPHYHDLYTYIMLVNPNFMDWLNCEFSPVDTDKDIDCAICLCDHDTFVKTKCGHIFGKKCILKWIEHGKTDCPMCRRNLV